MSFDDAVERVLEHEGGYVNDPDDPGGETNFGITKRSFPELDIAALTREDAIAIYWTHWWHRYRYDQLPTIIGEKVLDLAVNMGARRAHKLLQQALRAVGRPVVVDGLIGPKTRQAVEWAPNFALLAALRSEAAGYYRRLAVLRPSGTKYLAGWIRRAYA